MSFIWFWTFWHWTKESFRAGALLREPLHGIGGHWDEWLRREAADSERRAIEHTGRSEAAQRRFILWLCRRWAPEAGLGRNRSAACFVLGQLAQVPPFNGWRAFAAYRESYGVGGVQAIVLADKSPGEPADLRSVEALILPRNPQARAPVLVAEGFEAEAADLEPALEAAKSLLNGKGLISLLTRWLVCGRRPYSKRLSAVLAVGWLGVVGLALFLWFGPDPGERLIGVEAALVGLWAGLMLVAAAVAATVGWQALRTGMLFKQQLERSQVRLRMNGGLTLKGASAGLPFCLNILAALHHAWPQDGRGSWLWRQCFRGLCARAGSWVATGVVAPDGRVKPVVLTPKLRACLLHGGIRRILVPRQREAGSPAVEHLGKALAETLGTMGATPASPQIRWGFAAERPQLRVCRCRDVASAMMAVGGVVDRWQVGANLFALAVCGLMLAALPDLRSVLLPPAAPIPVPPASASPYELWVSLDTKHPEYFSVSLESDYWSNRRAEVKRYGGFAPSVRAEIPFHRLLGANPAANEEAGVVWIERRRRFLSREFVGGERVGRYSIPYLSHIGHE